MKVYTIPTNNFTSWALLMGKTPHIEVLEEDMTIGNNFRGRGKYWCKSRDIIFYIYSR